MTVIAYKGGIIAADTALWSNDVMVGHTIKIARRRDGTLFGAAGAFAQCETMINRFRSIRDVSKLQESDDPVGVEYLMIRPDGAIIEIVGENRCTTFAPFDTIGIGAVLAHGAMAAGATAEEAVAIAIQNYAFCGGDVVSLSQKNGTLKRRKVEDVLKKTA